MITNLRKLYSIIDQRGRGAIFFALWLMIAHGFFELLGIASIMPFIAILSDPYFINKNSYLLFIYDKFEFQSRTTFLWFVGSIICVIVSVNMVLKVLMQWFINHFIQHQNARLSSELFGVYLTRPYSYFLINHSADLAKSVLNEVRNAVVGVLTPTLNLVSQVILSACLLGLVLYAEPFVASILLSCLGLAYLCTYRTSAGYIKRLGKDRLAANRQKFRIIQESLGGIKEVKTLSLEQSCQENFGVYALKTASLTVKKNIISILPNFVLQYSTFVIMMLTVLSLLSTRDGDLTTILPTIVLFAITGPRIQSSLNGIYQSLTQIKFSEAVVNKLIDDITDIEKLPTQLARKSPLKFNKHIKLDQVSFHYAESNDLILDGVDIEIPKNTTVAFVGSTGAGKTTVMDIVLALITPTNGTLRVDDKEINDKNSQSWQMNIGYVSQNIFLKDGTVAANVAFGLQGDDIDRESVIKASKLANIHDFIVGSLPHGYDTYVGDKGIRLSGGQRQRIGIARALYHDPDVLVLDEATSSLDNETEAVVMDAINSMARKKTIIIVAHRTSAIQNCDKIYELKSGRVKLTEAYTKQ